MADESFDMPQETAVAPPTAPRRAPFLAAAFQKAYAQAVMIQGIDEQIANMLEQRERLEEEIHEIQSQLNDEFERMLAAAKRARLRLRAQLTQPHMAQPIPENIKLQVSLPNSGMQRPATPRAAVG
jgi:hypothetical protein